MIKQEIVNLISKKTGLGADKIKVTRTENADFGDFTTNIALQLKKPAQEIADKINSGLFSKVTVAGPGFINFFIAPDILQSQIAEILDEKKSYGDLKIGKSKAVNVEFISANPTGPLTLGNGRGGFCGDVLANVLEKAGYRAVKEYYINDTGEQIKKLGHSVIGDAEAVYKGPYIEALRKEIKVADPEKVGEKAAAVILKTIKKSVADNMKIVFDVWFSEKSLYQKKEVSRVLDFLNKKKLTYEKDGALWFKSTLFGDDKDRVLVKADGEETYLASDVAYLKDKIKRGFKKIFVFLGADHYGYVARIKAAAVALGYKKEDINIIIMQLVRLFDGQNEVRMSKRTGIYITIDELINEVGLDAARFFFLSRASDSHLSFDLNLAKKQSNENPVYYVQYAHARICSILQKTKLNKKDNSLLKLLNHPAELNLMKQLMRLPEVVEETAEDFQVQRLPQYTLDLATAFHQFYHECQVITEDKKITAARLSLITAVKIVLSETLSLMGVSAPEKM